MFFAKKSKFLNDDLSRQDFEQQLDNKWYSWQNFLVVLLILFAATSLSLIAFFGNHLLNIQFLPENDSKSKVIAEVPFSYISNIKTQKLYEQRKNQFVPIYHIDNKKYDGFIKLLKLLDESLENFSYSDLLTEEGRAEITDFIDRFNMSSSWQLEYQDIATIISSFGAIERTLLFQECISVLREIANNGVFNTYEIGDGVDKGQFQLKLNDTKRIRSIEEALHYLRMHILSMNMDSALVPVIFKILKSAIRPNMVYDDQESKIRLTNVLRAVKPVTVHVNKGDVLIESDVKIHPSDYEALMAYRQKLQSQNYLFYGIYNDFPAKILLVTLTIVLCFIGINTLSSKYRLNFKKYGFLFSVVLFNIILLRAFIQVGELSFFNKNFFLIYALYCLSPVVLGSIIATLMCGAVSGIFVSCVISIFYTLMLSRTVDFYLTILLINVFIVFIIRKNKVRGKIVKGGFLTGVLFALIILVHGLCNNINVDVIIWQCIAAVLMGSYTSVLALGSLPFFEKYFSMYTDISLLELTNYNNALLRRMQTVVPGTYHHCLVVSNLSEQVAGYVDANPFICKTGALYHDIGKMIKPEYFIENQNNGVNLHNQQTPYISSLIIRSHVKEGIEIAKKYNLPPEVIDIIKEHHGTTLVRYFYNLAKAEITDKLKNEEKTAEEIIKYISENLDESTFRYDGPRPQTKESAIVMLADSIEAASRSLKKVTHQSISNMLTEIFNLKLNEHQFDECPITLAELQVLKKAFAFTLVNMLHSRISYAAPVITNKKNAEQQSIPKEQITNEASNNK